MDTRTKKLTSMFLIVLLALTLTAPTLAEAGRKHHHHGHHHHHHHHGGYSYIYSQPPGYYRPYYPQPQYYYPAPVYAVPPQVIMGVDTGHASFMIRF